MNEPDHILTKARAYCASQEHCASEVRDKLREWKCPDDKTEKVISSLISEGFLDDERYARAFASGKFRINRWGMVKIRYELERRRIPANIIQAGLEEIDEEEYEKTLAELLTKKNKEIKDKEPFKRKQKLIAFAVQKGYEYDTIRRTLESIF